MKSLLEDIRQKIKYSLRFKKELRDLSIFSFVLINVFGGFGLVLILIVDESQISILNIYNSQMVQIVLVISVTIGPLEWFNRTVVDFKQRKKMDSEILAHQPFISSIQSKGFKFQYGDRPNELLGYKPYFEKTIGEFYFRISQLFDYPKVTLQCFTETKIDVWKFVKLYDIAVISTSKKKTEFNLKLEYGIALHDFNEDSVNKAVEHLLGAVKKENIC